MLSESVDLKLYFVSDAPMPIRAAGIAEVAIMLIALRIDSGISTFIRFSVDPNVTAIIRGFLAIEYPTVFMVS